MSHSHWSKDRFPEQNRTRRCSLPKAECDVLWREFQHGHEGRRCELTVLPGNVQATCKLTMTPEGLEARLSKKVRE